MAEFLIRNVDNTNPDPIKNIERCYKRGDLVLVRSDGHIWGRRESKQQWLAEGLAEADWPNRYVIIKIPDLTIEVARRFVGERFIVVRRRRLFRVLLNELPQNVKNKLTADGEYTANLAKVKNYIRSKADETTI